MKFTQIRYENVRNVELKNHRFRLAFCELEFIDRSLIRCLSHIVGASSSRSGFSVFTRAGAYGKPDSNSTVPSFTSVRGGERASKPNLGSRVRWLCTWLFLPTSHTRTRPMSHLASFLLPSVFFLTAVLFLSASSDPPYPPLHRPFFSLPFPLGIQRRFRDGDGEMYFMLRQVGEIVAPLLLGTREEWNSPPLYQRMRLRATGREVGGFDLTWVRTKLSV